MIENQNNFKLIAKTLYGLENELYNELILLGARNPRIETDSFHSMVIRVLCINVIYVYEQL